MIFSFLSISTYIPRPNERGVSSNVAVPNANVVEILELMELASTSAGLDLGPACKCSASFVSLVRTSIKDRAHTIQQSLLSCKLLSISIPKVAKTLLRQTAFNPNSEVSSLF